MRPSVGLYNEKPEIKNSASPVLNCLGARSTAAAMQPPEAPQERGTFVPFPLVGPHGSAQT